jgi:hypothetical protein
VQWLAHLSQSSSKIFLKGQPASPLLWPAEGQKKAKKVKKGQPKEGKKG